MRPSPQVQALLQFIEPSCESLGLLVRVSLDKELGHNGYVAYCNPIVGVAIGDHDLSTRGLEHHPLWGYRLESIPLVIPKFLSNVALRLGWLELEPYFLEILIKCLMC